MTGRRGVYTRIVKRLPLADPGRKPGAVVLVLACGHGRTSSQGRDGKRAWCRICSQKARQAVPKRVSQVQADRQALARAGFLTPAQVLALNRKKRG